MSDDTAVRTFYDCLTSRDTAALLDAVHNDFLLTEAAR
jgi:hypothetical protein